jgi:hypothetical protein
VEVMVAAHYSMAIPSYLILISNVDLRSRLSIPKSVQNPFLHSFEITEITALKEPSSTQCRNDHRSDESNMFRRIFESFQVFWVVVCSQAESDTLTSP